MNGVLHSSLVTLQEIQVISFKCVCGGGGDGVYVCERESGGEGRRGSGRERGSTQACLKDGGQPQGVTFRNFDPPSFETRSHQTTLYSALSAPRNPYKMIKGGRLGKSKLLDKKTNHFLFSLE